MDKSSEDCSHTEMVDGVEFKSSSTPPTTNTEEDPGSDTDPAADVEGVAEERMQRANAFIEKTLSTSPMSSVGDVDSSPRSGASRPKRELETIDMRSVKHQKLRDSNVFYEDASALEAGKNSLVAYETIRASSDNDSGSESDSESDHSDSDVDDVDSDAPVTFMNRESMTSFGPDYVYSMKTDYESQALGYEHANRVIELNKVRTRTFDIFMSD